MKKRYQVFVSSTYEDLRAERQVVIQSLLEFDCVPVGMEFFPAADDTAWEVIKGVIEECDYYVVIVAGKYGSLTPEGISYTQKEYEYAVEKDVPVMAFLHGAPGKITADKTEGNEESKIKLKDFRKMCQKRLCKHWKTADQLGGTVVLSLNHLMKTKPRTGWVRADQVPSESTSKEMLRLKNRIEELERERIQLGTKAPEGVQNLARGDDRYKILIEFNARYSDKKTGVISTYLVRGITSVTWNGLFSAIAPLMMDEATQSELAAKLRDFINDQAKGKLEKFAQKYAEKNEKVEDTDEDSIRISSGVLDTIFIQLRSLGLVTESKRKRSLKDKSVYWRLTPYGDNLLTKLIAIKRPKK